MWEEGPEGSAPQTTLLPAASDVAYEYIGLILDRVPERGTDEYEVDPHLDALIRDCEFETIPSPPLP